jgi:hypothetical protein
MSTEPTTDVRVLADAVRHSELSAEQREHLVKRASCGGAHHLAT